MNKLSVIFAIFCLLITIPVLIFVYLPLKDAEIQEVTPLVLEDDVLMVVGEETIYKQDLETEMSFAPNREDEDSEAFFINKLAKDSIILQAGAGEGRIKLDSTFYNNKNKNYKKRVEMIQSVRESVEQDVDKLEGTIVSIWFFNNDYVGPLGYEGGKTRALEKLRPLYDEVVAGNISIEEAGEIIASDTELASLDPVYKTNAIYKFSVKANDPITFDQEFNEALKGLPEGHITEIYTLKDSNDNTRQPVDAVHAFGKLEKRTGKGILGFEEWLVFHESNFKIIYNN